MVTLELQLPLPEQKAAAVLRGQIIQHLMHNRPASGSPLFTESQLCKRTGLSRSTIRRALSPLETSGWIERHQGRGTFVGPRVNMSSADEPSSSPNNATGLPQKHLRLAVVTERLHARQADPYSSEILRGLDAMADSGRLSLELIGFSPNAHDALVRRIKRSEPDVIVVFAPRASVSFVSGMAMMLKVPLIGTGDSAIDMGLTAISYDDEKAAENAVDYLISQGHRRIALAQQESNRTYILRRRRGFWRAIENAKIPRDQNLELWIPNWNALQFETPEEQVRLLQQFLDQYKPTALLLTEGKLVSLLGSLVRQGLVRVPEDLSVIAFDQIDADYHVWMGDMKPTVVSLPLEQIGRRIAELAEEVVAGRVPTEPIREHCQLILGDWVRPISK